MANKTPVWFDGGFGVFSGDDTFHHDYTNSSGNILLLQRSSSDVLTVANYGAASILPASGNAAASLRVGWNTGYDALSFYDQNAGSEFASIQQSENGASTQFQLTSLAPNHADAVAFRLLYKSENDTPVGKLVELYTTDTLGAEVKTLEIDATGNLTFYGGSGQNILWNVDGDGDIGTSGGTGRPDNVYAASKVFAGGSNLEDQYLNIGPQTTNNKHIVALQTGSNDPSIRWNEAGSQWEMSPDSSTWSAIGTSTVASWDDLYDLDQDLNINGASGLVWTQTSTNSGAALIIQRALNNTSTNAAILAIDSIVDPGQDDQPLLFLNSQQSAGSNDAYGLRVDYNQNDDGVSARTGGTVYAIYADLTPNSLDAGAGNYHAVSCHSSSVGAATTYGVFADENFDYGLYSKSPVYSKRLVSGAAPDLTPGIESIIEGNPRSDGDSIACYKATIVDDVSDAISAEYAGIEVHTSNNGGGYKTGLAIDDSFGGSPIDDAKGYGMVVNSKSVFQRTLIDSTLLNGADYSHVVINTTTNGVGTDLYLTPLDISIADSPSDVFFTYRCINLSTTDNSPAEKTGVNINEGFDYGLYSKSKVSVLASTATNFSNGESYAVSAETTSTGTGLLDNDIFIGYRHEFTPDADDSSDSYYYGFYTVGPATNYVPNYYGFYADGSGGDSTGTDSKIGFYVDSNWDYGMYSGSTIYSDFTAVGTSLAVTPLKVASYTAIRSPGFDTSGYFGTGKSIELYGDTGDVSDSYLYGLTIELADSSGSSSKVAIDVGSGFDYGVYSKSNTLTSVTYAGSNVIDVVARVEATSNGITGLSNEIFGIRSILTSNASDEDIMYVAYDAIFTKNVPDSQLAYAAAYYSLDTSFDYGLYVRSRVRSKHSFTSGAGEDYVAYFEANADPVGAAASDRDWTVVVHTENDADDNGSNRYAAIRVTGTDNPGGADIYGLYFPTTDASATGTWPDNSFAIVADAGLHYLKNDFGGSSGDHLWVETQSSSSISSGELRSIVASITPSGGESGFGITGIKAKTNNNQWIDHAHAFHAATTSSGKWSAGLFAENTLAVHADVNMSLVPASSVTNINSDGVFNSETNNTTALTAAEEVYGGLKVYHAGNASDASDSWIYGSHVSGDGNHNGVLAAYKAASGCDLGFYSQNVEFGLYIIDGKIAVGSSSDNVSITQSLIYGEYTSDGISGGNHFNFRSNFLHDTGDTGGQWFAFIAESTNTKTAVATFGYRAQGNLDIGFDSFAPTNRFIRNDDSYTGTDPVVHISNNDNDATGGTTPALRVRNNYDSASAKVIEIDSAYTSSEEGTATAIVFSSAKTNRRSVSLSAANWQSAMSSNTTHDFILNAPSSTSRYNRMRTYSTNYYNKAALCPLYLPHGATLDEIRVDFYQSGGNSSTELERPLLLVLRHPVNATFGYQVGSTVYAPYRTAGGYITMSITNILHTIDNDWNSYYLKFVTGDNTHGSIYLAGGYAVYRITDFSKAVGI